MKERLQCMGYLLMSLAAIVAIGLVFPFAVFFHALDHEMQKEYWPMGEAETWAVIEAQCPEWALQNVTLLEGYGGREQIAVRVQIPKDAFLDWAAERTNMRKRFSHIAAFGTAEAYDGMLMAQDEIALYTAPDAQDRVTVLLVWKR